MGYPRKRTKLEIRYRIGLWLNDLGELQASQLKVGRIRCVGQVAGSRTGYHNDFNLQEGTDHNKAATAIGRAAVSHRSLMRAP